MNYEKLGFKAGLEIHQQLETHKLFCKCPSMLRDDQPDVLIKRRLRAAAGETGSVDEAALHEVEKGKYFLYQAYTDTICLVELDEEPPEDINPEALQIALTIAKLLNAEIIDVIQVMRKTVIDGSNTTGFQRTALIARNGFIETSQGIVGIDIICLEEDAAKIVERTQDHDVYNLSRLGIPLVEIATKPDIKNPEHAKETAKKLGELLRSTKVKRGIGTIRQDINLSIKGGARVEVKGVQDLKSIPKIIEKEVKRQLGMIKKGQKPKEEVRKAEQDLTTSFLRPMPGASRMYPETDVLVIKPDLDKIEVPELIIDKIKSLEKRYKINRDMASVLVKKGRVLFLTEMTKKYKKVKPPFIANTILNAPKEIKKRYKLKKEISDELFESIFEKLNKNEISKDAVFEIILEYSQGKKIDFKKYKLLSKRQLDIELKKIINKNKKLPQKALIGVAMKKLRGKADGKDIVQRIKKLTK
jgi:Glu-tRNA(Gln) amidotransferase subunit E-like FAD-binding protein